jgi:PIN domain nuclease of toxin-antitoxin system
VILLDTHIWLWWIHDDPIPFELKLALDMREDGQRLAVSAMSCWEVAKLVEHGRLDLGMDIDEWFEAALGPSGITLIPLSPRVAAEACSLPGEFHRDPSDQIIVATSRVYDMPLVTADSKIRCYPYVRLLEGMRIHDR